MTQLRHVYKTLPARCVVIADEWKCNWQQSCEYFLSFDTIFIYIDRDFNINNCIQKWISRKRTFGDHANMCFAKCCCFACLISNRCGPNAVDLWLLWFHNCPQSISLAPADGSIHYSFRNALLKKVTKLHHRKEPIWRNYITLSILVMQFRHRWCKLAMMLALIQWRVWGHYLSVCCVL